MSQSNRTTCRAIFGLLLLCVLCATPALANHVDTANVTLTCNSFNLSVRASELVPGTQYQINYTIRGPASETHLEILFARDAARTPLVMRSPFSLGTFSMELVR